MSISKHLKLSTYTVPESKQQQKEPIETACVVSFSNYCWFDRIKDTAPKLAKCTKKDFDISFKLSSTAFKTLKNATSDYHFDKQGVKLTYNQCYTLFRSEEFVVEFIDKIKHYYQRDVVMNVNHPEQEEEQQQPEVFTQLPPPSDDEDDDDVRPLKMPLKNSIQNSAVKRLKKL